MSCPKCSGFILPDLAEYDEWHCLNCGLRLVLQRREELPALHLLQRIRPARPLTPEQKVARKHYMRVYMKAYRRHHMRRMG